jgi:hypothetical protein
MRESSPALANPPGPATIPDSAVSPQQMRCAVRFPISLPVVLSTGNEDIYASTKNVSASGVLFELDRELQIGSDIQFSLRMPGQVLGSSRDVLVECQGRVVRCSISNIHYLAAATIDEYRFCEQ